MLVTIGVVAAGLLIGVLLPNSGSRSGDEAMPPSERSVSGGEVLTTTLNESGTGDISAPGIGEQTLQVPDDTPAADEPDELETGDYSEEIAPPSGESLEDDAAMNAARIREQRMRNVKDLIMACYELIPQFGGQWPENAASFISAQNVQQALEVLKGSGRESAERNERLRSLPMLVYRRPPHGLDDPAFDPQWVVFHEVYGDELPEGGIAVGFADGHIEWIADKERLDRLTSDEE